MNIYKKYHFIMVFFCFCFGLLFFSQNVFAVDWTPGDPVLIVVKNMNGEPMPNVRLTIRRCIKTSTGETCLVDGERTTDVRGSIQYLPMHGDGTYMIYGPPDIKLDYTTFNWPNDSGQTVTVSPPLTNPDCVDTVFTPYTGKQICRETALIDYVGNLFDWVAAIVGAAAVLMIIFGGFVYMTSGGNEEKIDQAKQIIFGALAGVALIVLAQVIFNAIGTGWL